MPSVSHARKMLGFIMSVLCFRMVRVPSVRSTLNTYALRMVRLGT